MQIGKEWEMQRLRPVYLARLPGLLFHHDCFGHFDDGGRLVLVDVWNGMVSMSCWWKAASARYETEVLFFHFSVRIFQTRLELDEAGDPTPQVVLAHGNRNPRPRRHSFLGSSVAMSMYQILLRMGDSERTFSAIFV